MNEPIFIVGPARSGTTLLRVLLGGHRRLAALDELNFSTWVVQAHRALLRDANSLEHVAGFCLDSFRGQLRATHRQPRDAMAAAIAKPRWVDNTHTTNDGLVEVLDDLYEGRCVYLLVRRHPGDIVASRIERYREPDPFRCLPQLAAIASAQAQMREQIPERTCEVRYEDLVSEPAAVMAGVLAFLGETTAGYCAAEALRAGAGSVTVGDEKIQQRRRIDDASVGRWRSFLNAATIARLTAQPEFRECAAQWDYLPSPQAPSTAQRRAGTTDAE